MLIDTINFYSQWSGHPKDYLINLHQHLRSLGKNIIWLAGDSSLDNKAWLLNAEFPQEKYYREIAINNALGTNLMGEATNGYESILNEPDMVKDISYHLNKNCVYIKPLIKLACINTSVEASTLKDRQGTKLTEQDLIIKNEITPNDYLIVSVGGNDIAFGAIEDKNLLKSMLLLIYGTFLILLKSNKFRDGKKEALHILNKKPHHNYTIKILLTELIEEILKRNPSTKIILDTYSYSTSQVIDIITQQLESINVDINDRLPSYHDALYYIENIFKDKVTNYIKKLIKKNKPKLVLINTIYYPSKITSPSWISQLLPALFYFSPNSYDEYLDKFINSYLLSNIESLGTLQIIANSAIKTYIKSILHTITDSKGGFFYLLEAVIDYLYENATSKIEITGVNIKPIELSKVLDSNNNIDYDNRVEPSIIGGYKMAGKYAEIIGKYILESEESEESEESGESGESGESKPRRQLSKWAMAMPDDKFVPMDAY